jgi:hypothetical protein
MRRMRAAQLSRAVLEGHEGDGGDSLLSGGGSFHSSVAGLSAGGSTSSVAHARNAR